MGIYDRDYSRPSGGMDLPPTLFSPKSWSVNSWLIAICVLVFMLNSLLPKTLVSAGPWKPDNPAQTGIKDSNLVRVGPESLQNVRFWTEIKVPVLLKQDDGNLVRVGTQDVFVQGWLFKWGYFSTARALVSWDATLGFVGFEFWRFISFQFLHANLTHLLFNMIGLFFFGSVVEKYLGSKRYLAFYLLCGIMGACAYLLLNVLGLAVFKLTGQDWIPGLLFNNPETVLVGASAGVFGVIMAAAFLIPNATVLLFFILPMRLSTLAYGLLAIALLGVLLGWNNAGGEAAHIGGAIAGFYFIRRPHHLHGFFDLLGRVDPTSRSNRARKTGAPAPGRAVHSKASGPVDEAEIDRILQKIHEKGLNSLSQKEKRTLREASRR